MEVRQDLSERVDMCHLEASIQQHRLPVLVRLRDSVHGQQVVIEILKLKLRNPKAELGQPTNCSSFPVNSLGAAEPVDRHAQLRQGLLQDPSLPIPSCDQNDAVGHT